MVKSTRKKVIGIIQIWRMFSLQNIIEILSTASKDKTVKSAW